MFSIVATAVIAFTFSIWSKDGWLNLFIKFGLLTVTLWGVFETALKFGYVVKL